MFVIICDNSSGFITKELIQQISTDIQGAFKQMPIYNKEFQDRLHGRLQYDRTSDGEIVDGKGSGLTRVIVNHSPVSSRHF